MNFASKTMIIFRFCGVTALARHINPVSKARKPGICEENKEKYLNINRYVKEKF